MCTTLSTGSRALCKHLVLKQKIIHEQTPMYMCATHVVGVMNPVVGNAPFLSNDVHAPTRNHKKSIVKTFM